MKIKKLTNGLELRHSDDGYTLLFTPSTGEGGALLNMSNIANERGNITKAIMLRTMDDVIDEPTPVINIERKYDLVNFIRQLEPTDTESWCDQTVKQVADSVGRYLDDLDFDEPCVLEQNERLKNMIQKLVDENYPPEYTNYELMGQAEDLIK